MFSFLPYISTEPLKIPYASATGIINNGHCNNGNVTTTDHDSSTAPAIDIAEPTEESNLLLGPCHEIKNPHLLTVPTGIRAKSDVGDYSDPYDVKTVSANSFPVIDPPTRRRRRRRNSIRKPTPRPPSYAPPEEEKQEPPPVAIESSPSHKKVS